MKEILKSKIERFGFEDLLCLIGCGFLTVIIWFLFMFLTADREVRCYYLSSYGTASGIAYQIKADIDYKDDHTAFTSNDYKITLSVLKELPQCGRDANN
jgi:hypothetical protein